MATVRELVTKFGFDVDTTQLEKADHAVERLRASIFTIGASVIAASGALFGITKITADYGEETLKASKKLGISVESFRELSTAAYLADLSQEQFTTSLRFLNRAMAEAKSGNAEMAASLRKMGVNGIIPVDQAFKKILSNFNKLPTAAEKTAFAMQTFGRAGADMIPFLTDGNEAMLKGIEVAQKYQLVMSQEATQAASDFNDSLKEAFLAVKGLTYAIGNQLIPVVKPMIEAFSAFIADNFEELKGAVIGFAMAAKTFLGIMFTAFRGIWRIVSVVIKALGGFERVAMWLSVAFGVFLTGALASSIYAVGAAFIGLLPVLAPIIGGALAMGAAVLAAFLIIEDLFVSMSGGEGYFADLWHFLTQMWDSAIVQPIKAIPQIFRDAIAMVPEIFNTAIDAIAEAFSIIPAIIDQSFAALGKVVDTLKEIAGYVFGGLGSALKSAGNSIGSFLGLTDVNASIDHTVTPSPAAQSQASAQAGGSSVKQSIANTFTINPPASLPADKAFEAVQLGVENGLDFTLRGAARGFGGGTD